MSYEPIPSWTTAPTGTFGELRYVKDGRGFQRFLPLPAAPMQLQALLSDAARASLTGHNVYFGLNPRIRRSGYNHDVCTVTALFVDMDKVGLETIAELRQKLPPSAVINSGHGHHVYWLLDRGYLAYETLPAARRLCALCNSDPVWAPAQAPRLPNTLNWKTRPAQPVVVREASLQRYALTQITAALGALTPTIAPASCYASSVRLPKNSTGLLPSLFTPQLPAKLRRVYEQYETMDRSRADAALTVWAVSAGWSNERIVAMLLAPRRSKLLERMRLCGMQAAQAYAASTLGWARRKIAAQMIREQTGSVQ